MASWRGELAGEARGNQASEAGDDFMMAS